MLLHRDVRYHHSDTQDYRGEKLDCPLFQMTTITTHAYLQEVEADSASDQDCWDLSHQRARHHCRYRLCWVSVDRKKASYHHAYYRPGNRRHATASHCAR